MPKVNKKSSLKSSSKKNRSLKKKNIRKNKVKKNISRSKKSKNKNTKSKKRVMHGGRLEEPIAVKPRPLSNNEIALQPKNQDLINAISERNLEKVIQVLEGKSEEYIKSVNNKKKKSPLEYIEYLQRQDSNSIGITKTLINTYEQDKRNNGLNRSLNKKGIKSKNLLSIEKSIRGKLERSF